MTQLIAPATTEQTSADFTLAAAETTLSLKGVTEPLGAAYIQIKSSDANYKTIKVLTNDEPACVLNATGTFRVFKPASTNATGVDRD